MSRPTRTKKVPSIRINLLDIKARESVRRLKMPQGQRFADLPEIQMTPEIDRKTEVDRDHYVTSVPLAAVGMPLMTYFSFERVGQGVQRVFQTVTFRKFRLTSLSNGLHDKRRLNKLISLFPKVDNETKTLHRFNRKKQIERY